MKSKSTIIKTALLLISLALAGCAENGVQTAERQADNARKTTPIEVHINVPFSASDAKAALAKGDNSVSGVLYHRLTVSGREDNSWPQSPNIQNVPLRGQNVFLYPESAQVAELDKLFKQHQKIMENWYTGSRGVFNKQPQTKQFFLSVDAQYYVLKTTTDQFGRYRFDNLKPGRYLVTSAAWQSGTYNKSVYAGSSEVSDGTGIHGQRATIDHTKLAPVNYKTYLAYIELVSASKGNAPIDSRMRVDYNRMSMEYD
ncbi:MAG: hypothetical protein WAV95_04100 [Azonexus sp.]